MSSQMLNHSVKENLATDKANYSKVMLIDDNSLDNFVNKKLLETNGFAEEVTTYQSAVEALDFLKKASGESLPDVIFLDIMMPEMDGFQFLDAMEFLPESTLRHCKVIMLSTSESFRDLNRANKNALVKKFLNKPLTTQVISAIKI
ncbi:response regulator [soil metagenome]